MPVSSSIPSPRPDRLVHQRGQRGIGRGVHGVLGAPQLTDACAERLVMLRIFVQVPAQQDTSPPTPARSADVPRR